MFTRRFALAALTAALAMTALAGEPKPEPGKPNPYDPAPLLAAQRTAMTRYAAMDGLWRGQASTTLPSGETHKVTHTERVGPLLDGTIRLIEGRSYRDDGSTGFNAFAIVSFDPAKQAYSLHSYALGRAGDFVLQPQADGYVWEIPAGPTTIRYTATIKDGTWHEVGDRIEPGKPPARFFEMTLQRIGDSDWPGAGAVAPK